MRSLVFTFILIGVCLGVAAPTSAHGEVSKEKRKIVSLPTSNLGYLESPDFNFDPASVTKNVLKPGSTLADPTPISKEDPVCFYSVTISPNENTEGGPPPFNYSFSCPAPKGICPEMLDCARTKSAKPRWTTLELSQQEDLPANPLSDNCRITSKLEGKAAVFQFYDGNTVAEQLCYHRYTCDSFPAGNDVVCPVTIEEAENGTKKKVCSKLNSCLTNKVEMVPSFTEKELADKPSYESDKLRKQLGAPATYITTKKPSGNVVSSTSFQPRTANIAGSRTSVSNPPASKPPATGHTGAGRGMK